MDSKPAPETASDSVGQARGKNRNRARQSPSCHRRQPQQKNGRSTPASSHLLQSWAAAVAQGTMAAHRTGADRHGLSDRDGAVASEEVFHSDEQQPDFGANDGRRNDADNRKGRSSAAASGPAQQSVPADVFDQLVRRFGNYITDPQPDQFKPLDIMQQFGMCGTTTSSLAYVKDQDRLTRSGNERYTHGTDLHALPDITSPVSKDGRCNEPYTIRHTHSTPLHHIPSLMRENDDECSSSSSKDGNLPMTGLSLFKNRSRSTPLSTSANSAFGTISRHRTRMSRSYQRSAFFPHISRPSYHAARLPSELSAPAGFATFNPISSPAYAEDIEQASIEIVDLTPTQITAAPPPRESPLKHPQNASRTSRLLTEIKKFGRKRAKSAKKSPQLSAPHVAPTTAPCPPSTTSRNTLVKDDKPRRSGVGRKTVLQEGGDKRPDATAKEAGQACAALAGSINAEEEEGVSKVFVTQQRGIVSEHPFRVAPSLCRPRTQGAMTSEPAPKPSTAVEDAMDVDVEMETDETYDDFPIPTGNITCSVASPTHQNINDDRPFSRLSRPGSQSLLSSGRSKTPVQSIVSPITVRSSPMDMTCSNDSPGTFSRTSGTTCTSGHTTNATETTGSTERLSAMSHTDREVMEANRIARFLSKNRPVSVQPKDSDLTSVQSSSTASTNLAYMASDGHTSLRDGASLPADRFFTFADPQSATSPRGTSRSRTASSKSSKPSRSSSRVSTPSAQSSTVSLHDIRTLSPSGELPPTFVSYLERKAESDLTSLREEIETSCERSSPAHSEAREESPSEFLTYTDVVFEEAETTFDGSDSANKQFYNLVRHGKAGRMWRRVRSLPPRSPSKGRRTPTATPPPGRNGTGSASPATSVLSPPRNIVDYRPNVSKPHVVRTTPSCARANVGHQHGGAASRGGGGAPLQYSRHVHSYPQSMAQTYPQALQRAYAHSQGHGHGLGQWTASSHRYASVQACAGQRALNVSIRSRTCAEHSIEILKTESKDESQQNILSPEKPFDEV